MIDDFQENGQIYVMENLEKSLKRSWKIVEFQKLKRVQTLFTFLYMYVKVLVYLIGISG